MCTQTNLATTKTKSKGSHAGTRNSMLFLVGLFGKDLDQAKCVQTNRVVPNLLSKLDELTNLE